MKISYWRDRAKTAEKALEAANRVLDDVKEERDLATNNLMEKVKALEAAQARIADLERKMESK